MLMDADTDTARTGRRLPLVWRVFLANAAVMAIPWAILTFSPAALVSPLVAPIEGAVGLGTLGVMLIINLVLMRRALAPFERLTALMRRIDPLRPGQRVALPRDAPVEALQLSSAFNDMLGRLEAERRESARRALEVQENERQRLSRELHDEIGQSLTALVLQLEYAVKRSSPDLEEHLRQTREDARSSLEEVRSVARRLRPEALDDLGLRSALTNLCERVSAHSGFHVERHIAHELPTLSPEAELVLYRVAQESLTNAARHADASKVALRVTPGDAGVVLRVEDDGRGLNGAGEGAGITGMRERAILIGANLLIDHSELGGARVQLTVPARETK
jgi:two-component system sensor histidine kinase UhpB